jgi:hypothetical protein
MPNLNFAGAFDFSVEEELLCKTQSFNNFVLAPSCLLSQTAKVVTRVQVLCK